MRISPDLEVARTDLAEVGGYLLVLTPADRALLDQRGAAIERRWHNRPVYAICSRAQAMALGRSADRLNAMTAANSPDESRYAEEEADKPA